MKCVFCNVAAARKNVEHKEFGVSLGRFPAQVCPKCGEAYFDSDTAGRIQEKSKALGLFGLSAKAKVAQLGNNYAIRIPKRIAKFIGLQKGKEVFIRPANNRSLNIET